MNRKLRISELTKAEKKKLVKEICRICEKQYRKGYQQGFFSCKGKEITEDAVNEFRYKGEDQGYTKVVSPQNSKIKENPVERIAGELAMNDMRILNVLFKEQLFEMRRNVRRGQRPRELNL